MYSGEKGLEGKAGDGKRQKNMAAWTRAVVGGAEEGATQDVQKVESTGLGAQCGAGGLENEGEEGKVHKMLQLHLLVSEQPERRAHEELPWGCTQSEG